MRNDGFALTKTEGQTVVDFVMPPALEKFFHVTLYGRGAAMDAANGDPQKSWDAVRGGANAPLVAPYQVHGTAVVPARALYALPTRPKADGIFLDMRSNAAASLRFADCTPVVVAGKHPRPWMLLLHSGFAGTVKNIAGAALEREKRRRGILIGEETWAWIAPSICRTCYSRKKAGDPYTAKGMAVFSENNYDEKGEYVFFDIQAQISAQLEKAGVARKHIFVMENCTSCERDIFYSYRAGDAQGRNFLLARATESSL